MNESIIHADIFFFISTIALVAISIGIVVALVYLIRILRNVREVSDKVRDEAGEIVSDSKKLRHALKDEGMKWKHVAGLARGFFSRNAERKLKTKSRKNGEE